MKHNLRSVVFMSVIISLLVFLVGFRLGKQVGLLDKNYVPPTPSTKPTLNQDTLMQNGQSELENEYGSEPAADTESDETNKATRNAGRALTGEANEGLNSENETLTYSGSCDIAFDYPSTLVVDPRRTTATNVTMHNEAEPQREMNISCETGVSDSSFQAGLKSTSKIIAGQRVDVYESAVDDSLSWTMLHPNTDRKISFEVDALYFELLISSLRFQQ